jgi:2-hydroxy-3-oxopropionate reductase
VSERIGLIGLGVMGRPMALHLLSAGFTLSVHDLDAERVAPVVAAGAASAASAAAVADASDIVITMLPTPDAVEDVVLGLEGVLAHARPGALLVDMSTIAPTLARRLAAASAERKVAFLDAPVSGGEVGAENGTLVIMVGGEEAALERARPAFEALGSQIVHVGPHGAGQIVKACNQVVVALTYAAVSEALVLGSKSGVAPELILDVLSGGLAANRIMEVKRRSFVEHDFEPGGPVDMTYKDLRIALGWADEAGVPLPFTALAQQLYGSLRATGRGGLDHAALLTVFEEFAGHRIGEEP